MTRRRRAPDPARRPFPIDPELLVHLLLFAVIALIALVRSPGAYHDDDLDHFYMAKAALAQPRFLVDAWGRPGFTILYALPAQLGWNAVRVTTLLISLATIVVTWRTARVLKADRPGAWAGLAGWQPLFLLLSFSALTEPLAALILANVLYGQAARRPRWAAVSAGLLPLVRLELGIVAVLVAGWIVWRERKQWRELFWIPLPVLAWGVAGALIHGTPGWLLGAVLGSSRPLTSAGPIHYFRNLISVTGPAVFLGLFLGSLALVRGRSSAAVGTPAAEESRAPTFATLVFLVVFGLLTLLTWERLPFGGSIGFLRHLIVLAPAGALLAGFGYARAFRAEGPGRILAGAITLVIVALVALVLSHRLASDYFVIPGRDWSRLVGLVPVALLVLLSPRVVWLRRRAMTLVSLMAALFAIAMIRPIDLNVEQKVVKTAVDYLGTERLMGRPMMANHPWVYFLTGRDRWDRTATPYVTAKAIEAARPGTLAIWENHYGQRLYGDVPVEALREDSRWEMIYEVESGDQQFRVVIFERK